MAKTLTCPECQVPLDPRGYSFHRAAKHGVQMTKSKGAGESAAPSSVASHSAASEARPAEKAPSITTAAPAPAPAGAPPRRRSPFEILGDLL